MKKLAWVVWMACCSSILEAGTVLWNAFTAVNDGIGGQTVELHSYGFDVSFHVTAYDMKGFYLTARANDSRQGTLAPISTFISGAWMSAYIGDLSGPETLLDKGEYFFNELHGVSSSSQKTDIAITEGDSQYLKFVLQDFDEAYAYLTGQASEIQSLYFGWMEYKYDDGAFRILNSVIGLEGQSLTVGAIPEPSSAVLLLLGCVGLLLRRHIYLES